MSLLLFPARLRVGLASLHVRDAGLDLVLRFTFTVFSQAGFRDFGISGGRKEYIAIRLMPIYCVWLSKTCLELEVLYGQIRILKISSVQAHVFLGLVPLLKFRILFFWT